MVANPKHHPTTEADYLAFEAEQEIKHEFIDGDIIAMVGASAKHIRVNSNLFGQMYTRLRNKSCTPSNNDMKLKVEATGNLYYPDLTVYCGEPMLVPDTATAILLNPILIAEVLSPSTAVIDRSKKLYDYQQIPTLRAYLLLAQDAPRVDMYYRKTAADDDWHFATVFGLESSLSLAAFDVTLPLTEIYAGVSFEETDTETAPDNAPSDA